jgi:hypothetical protein
MAYVTVSVEVEVDMSDLDTEDMVEELKRRGVSQQTSIPKYELYLMLERVRLALYSNQPEKIVHEAKEYFYQVHNVISH